jgi:exopolysaccharide biosynthesis protein
VANIYVRDFSLLRTGCANKKQQYTPLMPDVIARQYDAVYAQNADFYLDQPKERTLILRDGEIIKNTKQRNDVMAFSPTGEMLVYAPNEIKGQALLDMCVIDSFNFGPILVQNGAVAGMKHLPPGLSVSGINPRSGFGMVKPGHYVGIVVEGRSVNGSYGCGLDALAELFAEQGCVTAYNFDGGQSAYMVFMGKTISESRTAKKTYEPGKSWVPRPVTDILRIGESGLVPAAMDKYPPEEAAAPSPSVGPS